MNCSGNIYAGETPEVMAVSLNVETRQCATVRLVSCSVVSGRGGMAALMGGPALH
jgi:hypothetical protein